MIQGWPWYALHFRENGLKWFFFLQNCTASSFSICNWKHLVIRSVFIPIPKKGNAIESVIPSNHLVLYCPLLLLPSIFPSIRVFSNESVLHFRWPKCWCFSFSISPSNGYSILTFFRMDWLDLLAVQGGHKSLLQHHSSKASILQPSAFFMAQLSHPYMTAGKTIALTMWTFVGKVLSLLFNILYRFCHSFPSKEQMSFYFMVAVAIIVILEPRKTNSVTVSIFPLLFAMKWWDWMPWS